MDRHTYNMSKIFFFFVLIASVATEAPKTSQCDEVPESGCTITKIEVNPCPKVDYCRFRKGRNASIVVDFTPNFTSSTIQTAMYWASEKGDLAFTELDNANACDYAGCPFEAGKPNQFDFSVHISKKLPSGNFPLKWKLWNGLNDKEACCFNMLIQLK